MVSCKTMITLQDEYIGMGWNKKIAQVMLTEYQNNTIFYHQMFRLFDYMLQFQLRPIIGLMWG